MLTTVTQLAGLVGLAISLILVAGQTRRLTQQTEVSNIIAKADVNNNAICLLHSAWRLVAEDPQLRPYFYDGEPCPPGDPNRPKALTVAEIAADAASYAILVSDLLPTDRRFGNWVETVRFVVKQPVVYEVINDHREWWPALTPHLPTENHMSEVGPDRTDKSMSAADGA